MERNKTKRWKKDQEGTEAQRKKDSRRRKKKTVRNAGTTVVHRTRRKTWGGLSRSLRHSSAFVLRDLAKTSSSIRRDSDLKRDDEEDEGEEADKQFLRHLREGQLKAQQQQQCKDKEKDDNKITRAEERRRRWKEEEANKENELKGSAGLYQMLRRGYLLSLQQQLPQTKCSKREDKSPPGQQEEVTTNQKAKERPKEEVGDEKEIKTCSIMTYNTVLPIRCNVRRHSLSELEDAEDRKRKRKQKMMAEAVTYCNRVSDELYQRAGGRLYILSFECHNQDDERLCDFIKPQLQHDVQEPEEEQEEEEEGRRGFVVRVRWALPVDLGGDTSQAESLAEWLQAHVPPEDPSLVESRMGVFHEVDLCQYQARMRALCQRHPLLPPTTHGLFP